MLSSWKLAALPADPFAPSEDDGTAEEMARQVREAQKAAAMEDAAAEAVFREAWAGADASRQRAGQRQRAAREEAEGEAGPTLLGRWRRAAQVTMCASRIRNAEEIRVRESDFKRHEGDLSKLRQLQVPPVPSTPIVRTFRESFEMACREPLPLRDPWEGLPNPERTRPSYESDLILNQILPASPKRFGDRPLFSSSPSPTSMAPQAPPRPNSVCAGDPVSVGQPRTVISHAAMSMLATQEAAPPAWAPRRGGRAAAASPAQAPGRQRASIISRALPSRLPFRKAGSW